eukprot:73539_1
MIWRSPLITCLCALVALSMSSNSNASQDNSSILCDDVLGSEVSSYFDITDKPYLRLINSKFARCAGPINGPVVAALRSLATMQPNDTKQMNQLRLFNTKYEFNELWVLHYLKMMKRNHYLSLLNGSIINDILHLPTLQSMEPFMDEQISALEQSLIMLSWQMFIEYSLNIEHFHAYQHLYQFLWHRIPSLPRISDLHQTRFRPHLLRMKQHKFVIWHHHTSIPMDHPQNQFEMMMTSVKWMLRNLNQSVITEFMLQFLLEAPVIHVRLTDPAQLLDLSNRMILLGNLGNQWQDQVGGWLNGLSWNQTDALFNILLQHICTTFSESERKVIATNLYTIMS